VEKTGWQQHVRARQVDLPASTTLRFHLMCCLSLAGAVIRCVFVVVRPSVLGLLTALYMPGLPLFLASGTMVAEAVIAWDGWIIASPLNHRKPRLVTQVAFLIFVGTYKASPLRHYRLLRRAARG